MCEQSEDVERFKVTFRFIRGWPNRGDIMLVDRPGKPAITVEQVSDGDRGDSVEVEGG